jgi:putative serine protease PepD
MPDEPRPDEAPATPPSEPQPQAPSPEPTAPTQPLPATPVPQSVPAPNAEFEAAEQTAAAQAAAAPPATGPSPEPPPVAGWSVPAQPASAFAPPAVPPASAPDVPGDYAAQTPAPHKTGLGTVVLVAVLTALVVAGITGLAGGFLGAQLVLRSQGIGRSASTITVVPSKTDEPVAAAAAAAVPSVVNIDVTESAASGGSSGLPSTHPTVPLSGNGSGVAFRASGDGGTYILTNNHVVENATTISVKSPAGMSWTGKVVGRDPENDIAVVKISGSLPLIKLGESKTLVVGQTVVAIGSPYGLDHSVTAGVVSAIGRSLSDVGTVGQSQPLVDTIQTDAAINPGNSGGALVDRSGQLIGINTAIYSQSGSAAGIGFAIPVDTAIRVADQLISGGKVTHPFIGLVGSSITPLGATQKKLPVQQGALVESVTKGYGAEKAGLQPGDIVTAADSVPVTSMTDLVAQIRTHSIGSSATLTILRGGKTLTLKVEVSDKPAGIGTSVPPTSSPTTP